MRLLDSVGPSRLSDTLRGFRQALRGLFEGSRVHAHGGRDAGSRDRRERGDLHAGRLRAARSAALSRRRPPRGAQRFRPGTRLGEDFNLAPEFFVEYREQADLLESVASLNFNTYTLRVDERVERVWMSNASLSLFETLGVVPQLGRLPTPEEGSQARRHQPSALARLVRRRPERASAAATRWPARCERWSA